jgi:hypothetical protein
MMKARWWLFMASAFAATLLVNGTCQAATIALTSDADTYTRSGVNAGSAAVMDIRGFAGGDFIGYFRFDLSSVPGPILDAKLTLSKLQSARNDVITTGRFLNYGLTNAAGNTPQNWDEATLAEGNVGAEYTNVGGNLVDPTQLFNLDSDTGANVVEGVDNAIVPQMLSGPDLVTFLNQRLADNGLATIISGINASGRGWGWGTKENADTAVWPKLEVTVAVPEPASWCLALVGLAIVGVRRRRDV